MSLPLCEVQHGYFLVTIPRHRGGPPVRRGNCLRALVLSSCVGGSTRSHHPTFTADTPIEHRIEPIVPARSCRAAAALAPHSRTVRASRVLVAGSLFSAQLFEHASSRGAGADEARARRSGVPRFAGTRVHEPISALSSARVLGAWGGGRVRHASHHRTTSRVRRMDC